MKEILFLVFVIGCAWVAYLSLGLRQICVFVILVMVSRLWVKIITREDEFFHIHRSRQRTFQYEQLLSQFQAGILIELTVKRKQSIFEWGF